MLRDLGLAWRSLLKQPGFTSVALLTVALGVGANSAIFSVVDAVMLRPLPFRDPDRVVVVNERLPQFPILSVSRENYQDVCAEARSFDACGAFRNTTLNLSGGTEPRRVAAKQISANLLTLLGVSPAIGRTFTASDDAAGGERVAILSYGLWQTHFGGRTNVIGERVLLDGQPYTVVGAMPATFRLYQSAEILLALGPFLATQPNDRAWHPGIIPVARLKDGVSLEQAGTEVAGIAARLEKAYPATNTGVSMRVIRTADLQVQAIRTALLVLFGAVSGVLLIACINVAGLLLARGLSRRRDIAVRIALGAGRGRIVGHLLAESMLLALGGGIAGVLLAAFAVPVLMQLVGPTLPRADTVAVDFRVVAFTLALALVTGVVFGLLPALQSARVDLLETLNEAGRGGVGGGVWQRRARSALVVIEVAVTIVLTIGAALLIRSFARLQKVSPGFDTEDVLAADLPLSSVQYLNDEARTNAVDRVIERASSVPGVRSAAITTFLPMSGPGTSILFNVKGRPPASPDRYALAGFRAVSGRYFETIGVPLRRGRLLGGRDRQGMTRVIVINESMAREYFANADPIGQHIQLGGLPDPDPTNPYMEIVGIVGDVRQQPDVDARSEMYVPYPQYPDAFLRRMYMNVNVVVRASGPPASLAGPLREIVREIDRDQPLTNIRTLGDVVSASVAQPRFRTVLLGVFAAIALTLAGIGVYGLLAHAVAQRTAEFGLRMALGASPSGVLRLVLRQGLLLALSGIVTGAAAALVAVRVLQSVLFDITPWDPVAWIVSSATLFAVALLASWLPARRALHVDPVVALRA